MKRYLLLLIAIFLIVDQSYAQIKPFTTVNLIVKTIEFPSKDNQLLITADWYQAKPSKAFALLCHQAGYSRGEYRETAPFLALKGISCLAIDQRSGDQINNVVNETAKQAKEKGLPTDYLDAKQDIEKAIDLAYEKNNKQPIILVGSSYSASLALLIGAKNDKVKAIAVFSPGEYLKGITLSEEIKTLNKPVFITAAKNEIPSVKKLIKNIPLKYITLFEPNSKGFHGSKALWKKNEGHQAYQDAFNAWLDSVIGV